IPVFDNNFQPPQGWGCRWIVERSVARPESSKGVRESTPFEDSGRATQQGGEGKNLRLIALDSGNDWHWLAYQNWNLDEGKVQPVRDEYPYNGSDGTRRGETVHDFLLECDVEVAQGQGALAFAVTDGLEWITAEVAVGASGEGTRLLGSLDDGKPMTQYRSAPELRVSPGVKHHVELAFADRRATLAVDGKLAFAPVDRPAVQQRPAVARPARLGARGGEAVFSNSPTSP